MINAHSPTLRRPLRARSTVVSKVTSDAGTARGGSRQVVIVCAGRDKGPDTKTTLESSHASGHPVHVQGIPTTSLLEL